MHSELNFLEECCLNQQIIEFKDLSIVRKDVAGVVFDYIFANCEKKMKVIFGHRLREIIESFNSEDLNIKFVKEIMKKNFDLKLFSTDEERSFLQEVEIVLKASVIYYLSLLPENVFEKFNTIEELLAEYPTFVSDELEPVEFQFLLNYRNMMAIGLSVIPAKGNKKLLMSACALLEGSRKRYITGGTQSKATARRVLIYERESNISPVKRSVPKVSKKVASSNQSREKLLCCCGAIILKRTNWKHLKSSKHKSFIAINTTTVTTTTVTSTTVTTAADPSMPSA